MGTRYEKLTGGPVNGDFVAGTVLIPFGNLPKWSDAELTAVGLRRLHVSDTIIPSISDRQFFQKLALLGVITKAEAKAAVAVGEIPQVMLDFVMMLPTEEEQFSAEMILSGAIEFKRDHPLSIAIGAAFNWTSDSIDEFFIQAATL